MHIPQSILDTDLYTFTVGQLAFLLFPNVKVDYSFRCRTPANFTSHFADSFRRRLHELSILECLPGESNHLKEQYGFDDAYVDFIHDYRFRPARHIQWEVANGELRLDISNCTWAQGIMYEIPLLSTINQTYFDLISQNRPVSEVHNEYEEGVTRLTDKIKAVKEYKAQRDPLFIEMGTRRRRSKEWQWEVYKALQDHIPNNVIGTSNVQMAAHYNQRALGTQSHQLYQAFQALSPLQHSLRDVHRAWHFIHGGKYATALTDIVGTEAFFRNFTKADGAFYSGFRSDSGDNDWYMNLLEDRLRNLDIDPNDKTLTFSNSLSVAGALDLHRDNYHRFRELYFGIGTNFTNDFPTKALNIVIKMTKCDGMPVAKISDDAGKGICQNETFLAHLRNTFQL